RGVALRIPGASVRPWARSRDEVPETPRSETFACTIIVPGGGCFLSARTGKGGSSGDILVDVGPLQPAGFGHAGPGPGRLPPAFPRGQSQRGGHLDRGVDRGGPHLWRLRLLVEGPRHRHGVPHG